MEEGKGLGISRQRGKNCRLVRRHRLKEGQEEAQGPKDWKGRASPRRNFDWRRKTDFTQKRIAEGKGKGSYLSFFWNHWILWKRQSSCSPQCVGPAQGYWKLERKAQGLRRNGRGMEEEDRSWTWKWNYWRHHFLAKNRGCQALEGEERKEE